MVLLFLKLKPIIKRTSTASSHCHCCWLRIGGAGDDAGICTLAGADFLSLYLCPHLLIPAIILVWGDIYIRILPHLLAFSFVHTHSHSLLVDVRTFIPLYQPTPHHHLANHTPNSAFLGWANWVENAWKRESKRYILLGPLVSTHRNFVKINCILVKSHSNWIEI